MPVTQVEAAPQRSKDRAREVGSVAPFFSRGFVAARALTKAKEMRHAVQRIPAAAWIQRRRGSTHGPSVRAMHSLQAALSAGYKARRAALQVVRALRATPARRRCTP